MSEDVKPRQWKIKKLFNRIADSNSFEVFQIAEGLLIKEKDTVKVIELEPTMRMMDDLANKLQILDDLIGDLSLSPNPESNTIRMEITYDILEKYRKFKEGLK